MHIHFVRVFIHICKVSSLGIAECRSNHDAFAEIYAPWANSQNYGKFVVLFSVPFVLLFPKTMLLATISVVC